MLIPDFSSTAVSGFLFEWRVFRAWHVLPRPPLRSSFTTDSLIYTAEYRSNTVLPVMKLYRIVPRRKKKPLHSTFPPIHSQAELYHGTLLCTGKGISMGVK